MLNQFLNNFRKRNRILQFTNKSVNQTVKSGFAVFSGVFSNARLNVVMMAFSLLLVGSCNESATILDFSKTPQNLESLSKADLMRYGYALQVTMHNDPNSLKQMTSHEVFLALSTPDLTRNDGRNNIGQYRTDKCVMDIFWRIGDTISHYEFRQRRSVLNSAQAIEPPRAWQCVQEIIEQRKEAIEDGFKETYAVLSLNAQRS